MFGQFLYSNYFLLSYENADYMKISIYGEEYGSKTIK